MNEQIMIAKKVEQTTLSFLKSTYILTPIGLSGPCLRLGLFAFSSTIENANSQSQRQSTDNSDRASELENWGPGITP